MNQTASAPPVAGAAGAAATQIAKAALRRLASRREEPTPANYARAWREEGGALDAPAPHLPAKNEGPPPDGPAWADLIERMLRGVERGSKRWTAGRKKDSLNRVLAASRGDAQRLHHRLTQLLASWDTDTPLPDADSGSAATPAAGAADASPAVPAAEAGGADPGHAWATVVGELESTVRTALPPDDARAQRAGDAVRTLAEKACADGADGPLAEQIAAACAQARGAIRQRQRLLAQLGTLAVELTDSLVDLAEDDSWAQGQCQAMRRELDAGLSLRGVRAAGQMLHGARQRQQQLRVERAQARDALKQLIQRMLNDIGELDQHTGRFNENVLGYAETISRAESLESLADVVREMVDETRAVHALVSGTQQRLRDEHARAGELHERVKSLEAEIRRLSDEVSTDQLTQVANRRGLQARFEAEAARAERAGTALAIGLLDIDNFKQLNDTLGHATGDEALKFLAQRVQQTLRPADTVARFGGEEFVVLLPETSADDAQQVLTRLQRTLSAELFMHEGRQAFVTFSAGVTLHQQGEPITAALERADEALYEAKRAGKNRTFVA
jgi:diguanylate cyclase